MILVCYYSIEFYLLIDSLSQSLLKIIKKML